MFTDKELEDWTNRYLNGTCTYNHLERLKNIGKLSEEQLKKIIVSKRLVEKGLKGVI